MVVMVPVERASGINVCCGYSHTLVARHSPEKVGMGTGCYLKMEALFLFCQYLSQSHSSVCSCTLGKACEMFLFFRELC